MWLISSLRLLTFLALAQLAAGCGIGGASGLYVNSDDANVASLQIVEDEAHQLSGTLTFLRLKNDGRVETSSVAITGVVDAENITLRARGSELFAIAPGLSGTRRGGRIDLTVVNDGEVLNWRLERASLAQFQRRCDDLRQRGQVIIDARTAQRQRQTIITLTQELQRTAQNDETGAAGIASRTQPYRDTTEAMRRWNAERGSITPRADASGDDRRAVLRDRIMSAHDDLSARHDEISAVEDQFEQHAQRLAASVQRASAACRQHRWTECADLNTAAQRYRTASTALRNAFQDAERTYRADAAQRLRIVDGLRVD